MAAVADLVRAAWRHRMRSLKARSARSVDMIFPAWMGVAIFARFATNCGLALREISRDAGTQGPLIAEASVAHFILIVFLFSFFSSVPSLGAMGLDRKRLGMSSASFPSLLVAEIVGIALSPMSAIVAVFFIPLGLVLRALPHPALTISALLLLTLGTSSLARGLAAALSASSAAARIERALRSGFSVIMLGLVLANFDFQWSRGPLDMFVFQSRFLLYDGAGHGILAGLRPWSPSSWIMGIASPSAGLPIPWLGALASAAFLAAAAGLFSLTFATSLRAERRVSEVRYAPRSHRRRARSIRGILLSHEMGLLSKTTGVRLGALASVGSAVWLLAARETSPLMPLLGAVVALALGFPYAANLFGHDGHALRRYILLSPDWAEIFTAKNAAFGIVTAAELAPLAAASLARLPSLSALAVAGSSILVMMLLILWGNISSMLFPSAGTAQGVFMNEIIPVAAWGVPFLLHRSVARFGSLMYLAAVTAGILACLALYRVMVSRIANHFEEEAGAVLERM